MVADTIPPRANAKGTLSRPTEETYTRQRSEMRIHSHRKITIMLSYAITFLVIALIAAVLGFGVLAGTAMWIAKICFVVFLVLFVISFISGRRGPVA